VLSQGRQVAVRCNTSASGSTVGVAPIVVVHGSTSLRVDLVHLRGNPVESLRVEEDAVFLRHHKLVVVNFRRRVLHR